jgi:hypothetical protein
MANILFKLLGVIMLLASYSSNASLVITASQINEINDKLAKAASNCDFKASTKFYFKNTKFFNYSSISGVESVEEQNFDEAITAIKDAMAACPLKLDREEPIVEDIKVADSGQSAEFIFESLHYLKAKDGTMYQSHAKGKTIFGVVDGRIVILESHYKGLSFEVVE